MRTSLPFTVSALAALALAAPVEIEKRTWLSYPNIDTSATPEAVSLLKYVQSIYGNHYISGQQDAAGVAWVKSNIGKTPAIQGHDFIDYSPSRVSFGAKSTAVEDAQTFDQAGGINAFVWHWNAPTGLYNSADEPWYFGFYTAASNFDLSAALAEGSSGANYQLLIRDIDAIAVEIQRLSDANIPILFRPLHEPEGGWFWWGAHGSAPFKQLWDIIYERITVTHGLHNMVWVCNTGASDWYPGNDKCDIATVDIYANAGDHDPQHSAWNNLYGVTGGQRVLALAEVGVIPDPASMTSSGSLWAFWMTWGGDFIWGGSDYSKDFLYSAYNDAKIVTVDGSSPLGSWKST